MKILLDTNVALRAYDAAADAHTRIDAFLQALPVSDEVFVAPQVIFELRVVLTRPLADNGFGLDGHEFDTVVGNLRRDFHFLSDPHDLVER